MKLIERRAFLLTAIATPPLAAYSPNALASEPVAQRGKKGLYVGAGQDRLGSPRTVFGGLRIDAKVSPADTGGDLYIIEHSDASKGGPPRHVHHQQDEWFYVLQGKYRVEIGDERFEIGPGDSIFAPREIPHVWAHTGEGAGRLIIGFQPAGLMESFLAKLAQFGSAPPQEDLRRLFSAHGMTVLGPPLPV